MLCPEVWSFDSPSYNAAEHVEKEWNDGAKKKLFNKIDRVHQMNSMVTVIIPNCPEHDQKVITGLIQERGSSYSVQGLALHELISPLFIEGFVKRGKFFALSIGKDSKANCIVSISPEGILNISLDKEIFQSLPLEGVPIQSSRREVDKYLCSVNLLDEALLKTTKIQENVFTALSSALLPKVCLQLKWEPPAEDICQSSVAKYFSDQGYEVAETKAKVSAKEELSRRLASFTDLTTDCDSQDIMEYLGILALDCSETVDEYLNSYQFSTEQIRVKNTLIVKAEGFYRPSDVQAILDAISSTMSKEIPWIALNTLGFTRTPSCERFFEDFYDVSSERALTFLLNSQNQSLVQQIFPKIKNFSK